MRIVPRNDSQGDQKYKWTPEDETVPYPCRKSRLEHRSREFQEKYCLTSCRSDGVITSPTCILGRGSHIASSVRLLGAPRTYVQFVLRLVC